MISMQHATYCHSNQHCESSLSVFWEKIWENSAKKKTTVKKNFTDCGNFFNKCENFFSKYEIFFGKSVS